MAKILIIDDDEMFSELLALSIKQLNHDVMCAHTLKDGLKEARSGKFDVVFLDVRLPDGNGLEMLPKIRQAHSSPEVIIITGAGDSDGAELAIKSGAWDYIEKASSHNAKILALVRVIQYREQKSFRKIQVVLNTEGLIGDSPEMKARFDLLAQAAGSEAPVLIIGETGTGKERFAYAIHTNSIRSGNNFVVVDCAALPETLVASLLFGHRKGAFTGANQDREGLIEQADGGTLFLDEVGEIPLSMQKSFLRVLQDRSFRPLGSQQEEKSDFRLVAATNRNLDEMVQKGQFREDLLFRLKSLCIELPPLRSRPEDIKKLALHYLDKICKNLSLETKDFSPEFLSALLQYDWPGNVRELINSLEKAVSAARYEQTLFPAHLPLHIRIKLARESVFKGAPQEEGLGRPAGSSKFPARWADFREGAVAKLEKQYFRDLACLTKGDINEACRISGLSQSRLYSILKKNVIDLKKGSAGADT